MTPSLNQNDIYNYIIEVCNYIPQNKIYMLDTRYGVSKDDLINLCYIEYRHRVSKGQKPTKGNIARWCQWKVSEILRRSKRSQRCNTEFTSNLIGSDLISIFSILEVNNYDELETIKRATEIISNCFRCYPRYVKLTFILKLHNMSNVSIAKTLGFVESRVVQILTTNKPILERYIKCQSE